MRKQKISEQIEKLYGINVNEVIGKIIRRERKNAGLTQTELGKIFNTNFRNISNIEKGIVRLTPYEFMIILKVLYDTYLNDEWKVREEVIATMESIYDFYNEHHII